MNTGNLSVRSLTDDERRYRGQIQIPISGDARGKYGLGGPCRRQNSTRAPCGIHGQIHVLAHQPQGEFWRVVAVLYFLEFPHKGGRYHRRFGQDIEHIVAIDFKVFSQRNCFPCRSRGLRA
jgi:hypothetical protein